jgi:hypothetical protein
LWRLIIVLQYSYNIILIIDKHFTNTWLWTYCSNVIKTQIHQSDKFVMHLYHFIMNWKHTNSLFAFTILSLHLFIHKAFLFWQSPIHILWVNCFLCASWYVYVKFGEIACHHVLSNRTTPTTWLVLQLGGERQTPLWAGSLLNFYLSF